MMNTSLAVKYLESFYGCATVRHCVWSTSFQKKLLIFFCFDRMYTGPVRSEEMKSTSHYGKTIYLNNK